MFPFPPSTGCLARTASCPAFGCHPPIASVSWAAMEPDIQLSASTAVSKEPNTGAESGGPFIPPFWEMRGEE